MEESLDGFPVGQAIGTASLVGNLIGRIKAKPPVDGGRKICRRHGIAGREGTLFIARSIDESAARSSAGAFDAGAGAVKFEQMGLPERKVIDVEYGLSRMQPGPKRALGNIWTLIGLGKV